MNQREMYPTAGQSIHRRATLSSTINLGPMIKFGGAPYFVAHCFDFSYTSSLGSGYNRAYHRGHYRRLAAQSGCRPGIGDQCRGAKLCRLWASTLGMEQSFRPRQLHHSTSLASSRDTQQYFERETLVKKNRIISYPQHRLMRYRSLIVTQCAALRRHSRMPSGTPGEFGGPSNMLRLHDVKYLCGDERRGK